jgi:hypothetical protein
MATSTGPGSNPLSNAEAPAPFVVSGCDNHPFDGPEAFDSIKEQQIVYLFAVLIKPWKLSITPGPYKFLRG